MVIIGCSTCVVPCTNINSINELIIQCKHVFINIIKCIATVLVNMLSSKKLSLRSYYEFTLILFGSNQCVYIITIC